MPRTYDTKRQNLGLTRIHIYNTILGLKPLIRDETLDGAKERFGALLLERLVPAIQKAGLKVLCVPK